MVKILKGTTENYNNVGIHMVSPVSQRALEVAKSEAKSKGYGAIYIHGKGTEVVIKKRMMRKDKKSQNRRDLTRHEEVEVLEYYRFASADSGNKHERMVIASRWFSKRHPDVTPTVAYKVLDAKLHE